MRPRVRVEEKSLKKAFLIRFANLFSSFVRNRPINEGEFDAARFRELGEAVSLVVPVEEHDRVLALRDDVEDELVPSVVDELIITFSRIDRSTCDLQQLVAQDGGVDCVHHLVLQKQDRFFLHLPVRLHQFGAGLVGHEPLAVGRDVHALFELVANGDVVEQVGHGHLGAGLVFPRQVFGLGTDLRSSAGRLTEREELGAQAFAVVEQVDLMPHVRDGLAVGCTGQSGTVMEVIRDFGSGLGAVAGAVFVERQLVDHQRVELGKELFRFLGQPFYGVDIGDVDVDVDSKCCVAIFCARNGVPDTGEVLLDVSSPRSSQQRARRKHEHATPAPRASFVPRVEGDPGLSGARIAGIEYTCL